MDPAHKRPRNRWLACPPRAGMGRPVAGASDGRASGLTNDERQRLGAIQRVFRAETAMKQTDRGPAGRPGGRDQSRAD